MYTASDRDYDFNEWDEKVDNANQELKRTQLKFNVVLLMLDFLKRKLQMWQFEDTIYEISSQI